MFQFYAGVFMRSFIFPVVIVIIILAAGGCSDNKTPEPRLSHLRLVADLFISMQNKDHHNAVILIGKLKAVMHDNVFLSTLEESETGNIFITPAQKELDQGNIANSLKIINDGLNQHPLNSYLIKCRDELLMLEQFQKNITAAVNPRSAAELKAALDQLDKLLEAYPPSAAKIKSFVDTKKTEFAAMDLYEQKRAFSSLVSEYELQMKTDRELAKIIAAQIEYEKDSSSTAD